MVATKLMATGAAIAWRTFQPVQKNIVTWNDNYGIYATTTELAPGNRIIMNTVTDVPVQIEWTYTFEKGQFSAASNGTANVFTVANQMNGMFSFGLAQQSVANNVTAITPLSAISALFNQEIFISPPGEIFIFLSSVECSGTILYEISSNALAVPLSNDGATIMVGFNNQNNTFFLQG
jgi:hypothetical protein